VSRGALATLALWAGLGGCGEEMLDTSQVERDIAADLAGRQAQVDCPGDVEARKGDTFECSVELRGKPGVVRVTQLDGDGRVRWSLR